MLDRKIINGRVVDGTGRPAYRADLGIRAGRIACIGKVDEPAREVVDAEDAVIAPGFIDVHTHYDAQVFWDRTLSPSCYHGVTTVVGGFCGFSIAPLTPSAAAYIAPMLARVEGMPLRTLREGVAWNWESFASYLQLLEGRLGVNAGFFVGHSAVRRVAMGSRAVGEPASERELVEMERLVAESLAAGALGFSTTVNPGHNDGDGNPVPSRHAAREEFLRLASVCRRYEGTGLELLPNHDFAPEMVELMIDFSLAGQRPVNWNVLAINGSTEQDIADIERKLAVSDRARERGAKIIALVFPASPSIRLNFYSGFVLDSLVDWAPLFRLRPAERKEKLKDPAYRRFLDEGARSTRGIFARFARFADFRIDEVHAAENQAFLGRSVAEAARTRGQTAFDAMLDIAIADDLKTSFMPPTPGEDHRTYELRGRIWTDPRTVVGASDAGAHMDMSDGFAFSTRLLQNGVRDHRVIALEEAVRQVTAVPAQLLGLRERGALREGWIADLVIFRPGEVGVGPTYTRFDLPGGEGRLYADAQGIDEVIVGGATIVKGGKHTGALPGQVLRSGRDTYTVPLA